MPSSTGKVSSRAPEFHGFVAWTSTALLFMLYLLWALLPDDVIVRLGIRWYPNREWAILFPSWTITLILFTYFAYSMLAITRTPSFSDLSSIKDRYSKFQQSKLSLSRHEPFTAPAKLDAPPETYDMPVGMINRVLYRAAPWERVPRAPSHAVKLNCGAINSLPRSALPAN